MKKILSVIIVIMTALSCVSCNISPDESFSSEASLNSVDDTAKGGDSLGCLIHNHNFHFIDSSLIEIVDNDRWEEWLIENGSNNSERDETKMNNIGIYGFVKEFDITKDEFIANTRSHITDQFLSDIDMTEEEYLEDFSYTDAQIDAMYSNDQAQINEVFCNELAVAQGDEIYPITWLAEHTEADYEKAKLDKNKIQKVIDTIDEDISEYGNAGNYKKFEDDSNKVKEKVKKMK